MRSMQKLKERALAVPIVALVLWTPPLVHVFSAEGRIAGIPVLYVYFFGGWALLIVLGGMAARRLCQAGRDTAQAEAEDERRPPVPSDGSAE